MKKVGKYDISFLGEFVDKSLEKEFFQYDMKCYSKLMGPVALIFGIIYMMFLISDYFAIENTASFMTILVIRVLFLMVSAGVYFGIGKIDNYDRLAYLITAYEIWAIVSFLLIINQYGSLGLISFFSVMAITLAVYITPNKLKHALIISVFLSVSFFILYVNHVEDMDIFLLSKIISYNLILIIFSNIGAYLTNFYKRKQFADGKELFRLSITDPLTGIYNRAKFADELNRWTDYSNRYNNPLSLVIFDIDDFKRVNDNYGHLTGDTVLQSIAGTIKNAIRQTDIFARWGGEEFVILLPNTDVYQASEMTERMRICIEKNKYDKVDNITCSFGLVTHKENESSESMLQRVDKFLYDAKGCGKNTVVSEAGRIEYREAAVNTV